MTDTPLTETRTLACAKELRQLLFSSGEQLGRDSLYFWTEKENRKRGGLGLFSQEKFSVNFLLETLISLFGRPLQAVWGALLIPRGQRTRLGCSFASKHVTMPAPNSGFRQAWTNRPAAAAHRSARLLRDLDRHACLRQPV